MHRCISVCLIFACLIGLLAGIIFRGTAEHSFRERTAFDQAQPTTSQPHHRSVTPVVAITATGTATKVQDEDLLPSVFMLAPREVDQLISRAQAAIDEQRYVEAVALLSEVLMTDLEDYFTRTSSRSRTARSIKQTALDMIGELPPRGREAWELRFGASAQAELEAAVEQRDFRAIAAVAQRYLHTKAGYEAMILLGRQQLYEGQFLQAARCFDRVYPYLSRRDELHLESALLAATAWILAEREDLAEASMFVLASQHGGTRIPWNQSTLVIGRDVASVQQQLATTVSDLQRPSEADLLQQWVVHRGAPDRNAVSEGGMPLIKPLWRVFVHQNIEDEDLVGQIAESLRESKSTTIPSAHALVVAGSVIMRSPSMVMGIDLQTGKTTWIYPWDNISLDGSSDDEATKMMVNASREKQLRQRLWEDHIHGRMTSDGKRLFFVDGLGYASRNKYAEVPGVPGQAQVKAFSARDVNHLVALELVDDSGEPVEGKLAWRIGDSDGMDQPDLAGIFFLGPPLPVEGKLFAIAEYQGEVKLLCLNSRTGTVQWSQQLATVHEVGSIQLDGLRRLAGAVPSYGEGILVCPTAAGAIVAIDPATQSLLWGYQFPFRENERYRATRSYRDESRSPGQKWADDIVAIVDGKVILTPIESESLYCLDLYTGELVWESPLKREDKLFVGGVYKNLLYSVSAESIQAFRLETAEPLWTCSLKSFGGPSGEGFMSEDSYFLPTNSSNLVQVDLTSGEIVSSVIAERPLGNLISLNGRIISHGVQSVDAYYQDQAAREEASRLLAADPLDANGLSLRGQLELQSGEWQAAVATMTTALEQKNSESNKELLVTALVQGLRTDFETARQQAEPFRDLLLASSQRYDYLRLQVEGLLESGQVLAAFDQLMELASGTDATLPTNELKRTESDERQLLQDRWYQATLVRLFQEANPGELDEIQQQLTTREAQLMADNNYQQLSAFDRLVRPVFPNPDRLLQCGRLALDDDRTLAALRYFENALEADDNVQVAMARLGLAQVFLQSQRVDSAWNQLGELELIPGDLSIRNGRSVADAIDELRQHPLLKGTTAAAKAWSYGAAQVDEGGDVIGARMLTQYFPVIPVQNDDIGVEVYQLDHDQQQNGILRDRFGNALLTFPLRNPTGVTEYYGSTFQTTRCIQHNGMLIVVSGYDIIAIDLTQLSNEDEVLMWRQSLLPDTLPDPSRPISRHRVNRRGQNGPLGWSVYYAVDTSFRRLGAVGPITDTGFCFVKQNQLVCVDPLTGEPRWKRSDIELGSDCLGNDETVIVMDPGYDQARLFRMSDGSLVKEVELNVGRSVLTTFRDQVLSYEANADSIRLRLDSLVSEETVWDQSYPIESRATLIAPNEFAVLTPTGEFEVRSLADGQTVVKTQLAPDPDVKSILVTRDETHYVLAANHNSAGAGSTQRLENKAQTNVSTGNQVLTLVKGNLWAISRQTGNVAWGGPAYLDQFGFSERQTYSSPVLMLLRHHAARSERGATTSRFHSEVVLLDKRDGRLLLHLDDIPQMTYKMHITASPANQRAVVELNAKQIEVSFSGDTIPPSAPADTRRFRPGED